MTVPAPDEAPPLPILPRAVADFIRCPKRCKGWVARHADGSIEHGRYCHCPGARRIAVDVLYQVRLAQAQLARYRLGSAQSQLCAARNAADCTEGGFYTGTALVNALALLRAGQVMRCEAWLNEAARRCEELRREELRAASRALVQTIRAQHA